MTGELQKAKLRGQRSRRTKRRFYRTWIKEGRAKQGAKGNGGERNGEEASGTDER